MFSLDRSGAVVSGADLGATFCARTPAQVIRTIVSTAKATRNFFMVVLLEVRAFCAFIYLDTATMSPVRIERPAGSWEEAHIILVSGAFVIPHLCRQDEHQSQTSLIYCGHRPKRHYLFPCEDSDREIKHCIPAGVCHLDGCPAPVPCGSRRRRHVDLRQPSRQAAAGKISLYTHAIVARPLAAFERPAERWRLRFLRESTRLAANKSSRGPWTVAKELDGGA